MFIAWRDVRFAKGRFALIISVVVMITLLVGMLSGLMTGLRGQSVSAIEGIHTDQIVFSAPAENSAVSFSDSSITTDQLTAWTDAASSDTVHPIGIAMSKLAAGQTRLSVSLFGVESGFGHASGAVVPTQADQIVLSAEAADQMSLKQGDHVAVNGHALTVGAISGEAWFSHAPVAWVQLTTWQQVADTSDSDTVATVLAVSGMSSQQIDDLTQRTNTNATSLQDSYAAVSGFQAENGSLTAMLGMLLAISALVIGAFFTVWTIQRTSDIAILKALGGSTWSLARDALGQALMVLTIGITFGLALTAIIGSLVTAFVPFVVSLATTLIPGALLMGLGLAGAAFALRTVVKSDPLTAIAANR